MSHPNREVNALVTGGSRGIGAAIAQALAERGCRVAVQYHQNRDAARRVLDALPGESHALFQAELTEASGIERLWREVAGAFGNIDVLINNAGIFGEHPPLTTTLQDWQEMWRRTLGANLLAPADLCHLAANAMANQETVPGFGRGRIVNISSRGAFRGEPDAPAYGASKAGLNALSQSLAKALAPREVYVFCVAPGWVDTDMAAEYLNGPAARDLLLQHPLGRVATAAEIATTTVFCALDAPATMTGAIIDVNGASYLRT